MFKGARIVHLMICFGTISVQASHSQNSYPEHFGQQNPMRTIRSPRSPIINPCPYENPNITLPKQTKQDKNKE